jgi:hypothetical protein
MRTKCGDGIHVWHVTNEGEKLNPKCLKTGHVCACGTVVIYRHRCSCGSSHKRVDTIENVRRYENRQR